MWKKGDSWLPCYTTKLAKISQLSILAPLNFNFKFFCCRLWAFVETTLSQQQCYSKFLTFLLQKLPRLVVSKLYLNIWRSFSIKDEIFPKELAIGNTVYSFSFYWWGVLSYPPKTFSMIFFTRMFVSIPWNLFFTQAHHCKSMFSRFVRIFWTKTCFSIYIPHSFVYFIWFAFLSHQEVDDRPLFNPGALGLIYCHFE